jgi:hypothetical protein
MPSTTGDNIIRTTNDKHDRTQAWVTMMFLVVDEQRKRNTGKTKHKHGTIPHTEFRRIHKEFRPLQVVAA